MLFALRRLSLGLFLAVVVSAILLASDWSNRKPSQRRVPPTLEEGPGRRYRITLVQLVSSPAIDATREGVLRGLAEGGVVPGRDVDVKVRDAQGEFSALPGLVDAASSDRADLLMTITTPVFQAAMARTGDLPVVFALTLDPLLVGEKGTHERHRPNVTGVYDRSPFEELLGVVKELLPGARTIGTLFNPAELNSVTFQDEFARAARRRGLELVSVASDSPAGVTDAALALLQRKVDAVCQINDNLHEAAFAGIATAARRGKVPLFAFSSPLVHQGAAVALANDHADGGREAGLIAARVLRGESPAAIPYRGITKTVLAVNPAAAAEAGLRLPEALVARSALVVGERPSGRPPSPVTPAGLAGAGATVESPRPLGRPARLELVHFTESTMVGGLDEGAAGGATAARPRRGARLRLDGSQRPGRNVEPRLVLAPPLATHPDVLLLTSTPTLQAALKRVNDVPVVFNIVANPILAGAGTSLSDHAPNVTGISTESDFAGMARTVRECLPRARRVGTLFDPGEDELGLQQGRDGEGPRGGRHRARLDRPRPRRRRSPDAALALTSREIDAICQVNGNMRRFRLLGDRAGGAKGETAPLRLHLRAGADRGCRGGGGARLRTRGADQARLAARILRGERPGAIPIELVSRTLLVVNVEAAASLGLTVPPSLLARADQVVGR